MSTNTGNIYAGMAMDTGRWQSAFEVTEDFIEMLKQMSAEIDQAGKSSEGFNVILKALKENGMKSLGDAVSKTVGELDIFKNATGMMGVTLSTLQGGLKSVLNSLSPTASLLVERDQRRYTARTSCTITRPARRQHGRRWRS